MKSKQYVSIGLIAVLALSACVSANKGDLPPEPSSVHLLKRSAGGALVQQETEILEATVRITAMDRKARRITVLDSAGESIVAKIPAEVKRFDEFKVGDMIVLRFAQSLAFEVRPAAAGEKLDSPDVAVLAGRRPQDLPPGAEVAALVKVVVRVEKIDLSNNTVTFRGAQGAPFAVRARYPENLKRVQVGDTVVVMYGEALALDISRAGE